MNSKSNVPSKPGTRIRVVIVALHGNFHACIALTQNGSNCKCPVNSNTNWNIVTVHVLLVYDIAVERILADFQDNLARPRLILESGLLLKPRSSLVTLLLKGQPHDPLIHCQTVN